MKPRLILFAIVLIVSGAYGYFTSAKRGDNGEIVSEGQINSFALKPGDCFDDTDSTNITSLPAVPCAEPHDNEVYAVFDVSLPTYESEEATFGLAVEACVDRFDSFVGKSYEESKLDILTLYPTLGSWQEGDREIVCAVYDIDGEKLVGSAEGIGL